MKKTNLLALATVLAAGLSITAANAATAKKAVKNVKAAAAKVAAKPAATAPAITATAAPASVKTEPTMPSTTETKEVVNTTTTGTAEVVQAAPATGFAPGVTMWNTTDAARGDVIQSTLIYAKLGYKISPTLKASAVQRFQYDQYRSNEAGRKPYDKNLRLELAQSGIKALGGDMSVLYRLSPPTALRSKLTDDTAAGAENNFGLLTNFFVNPEVSWELTNKISVGYNIGYWMNSYTASFNNMTAFNRMAHAVANTASATYNFTDKFNVYQSIGQTMALRNYTKGANPVVGLSAHGSYADLETGLNFSATKTVALNLFISQSHSIGGESGNVGILANNGEDFGTFMLYRPEQTSYNLITSVSF